MSNVNDICEYLLWNFTSLSNSITVKFVLNRSILSRRTLSPVTLRRLSRPWHFTHQIWSPATQSPKFLGAGYPYSRMLRNLSSLPLSEQLFSSLYLFQLSLLVVVSPCEFLGVASVLIPASRLFIEDTLLLFLIFPKTSKQPLATVTLICCRTLTTHTIFLPYYSVMVPVD